MRNKGAALIIVLGILMLLALLGTTFATLTSVERQVSRNYLDTVRAKHLAMSGVDDAVDRLTRLVEGYDPSGPDAVMENRVWKYWGDDLDETAPAGPIHRVSLDRAKNPSFAVENDPNPLDPATPQPKPILILEDGAVRTVGISGVMGSASYAINGDVYTLRVTDLQGLIHVNDGLEHGPNGSVSQNLRRILNCLGGQASINVPGLGDKILQARPGHGYRTKREILAAVNYDEAVFARFKDFVTPVAWQDAKVCNPVPLSDAVIREYPVNYYRGSPAVYRYGRGKDAAGNAVTTPLTFSPPSPYTAAGNALYAYDELNPQWIEIVKRAPVNVNSAPREVLIALLDGLRGFFMVERRRNEPPAFKTVYSWLDRTHQYRPASPVVEGGEIGFLYSTVPIQGGSGATGAGNSWALWIADEIVACRERRKSLHVPGLDYASVAFGGPFRSWRQFNLFCDRLADPLAAGFLQDTRPIYVDYHPMTDVEVPSEIQKRYAAAAIADVLKANFNPNLHLNETNPEAQLWTRVDKTDLIVNSTEFCFTPMGLFEIESLGRILRATGGGADAFTAASNEIVAQAKVTAMVKLMDVYRETHQSEFARGSLSPRSASPPTNNNMSIEIGPEPDNGKGPSENEWSGYLALPTIGGHALSAGGRKAPNTLETTPQGGGEYGSRMHAHFALDGRLHHHASGIVKELASEVHPNEYVQNVPDRTELTPGPYTPVSNGGNRHRLARSFRLPRLGGGSPPPLAFCAPLDLRIDGMYLERHSGLGYWLDAPTIGSAIEASQGVFSFWVKPGYHPEMTGKTRSMLSADRKHGGNTSYINPSPFCMWSLACHDSLPYQPCLSEGTTPIYDLTKTDPKGPPFGVSPMRATSLAFGYGYSDTSGYQSKTACEEGGVITPTLNHETHPDKDAQPSVLRGHRWINITGAWDIKDNQKCAIYVNGKLMTGTDTAFYKNPKYDYKSPVGWFRHQDGTQNCLRLSATSGYCKDGVRPYSRNWAADATLDEFYWWNSYADLNQAVEIARLGRFYKPVSSDEATLTSQEIDLTKDGRLMPPPSTVAAPGGMLETISTAQVPAKTVRLVGAQWTLYGEFADTSKAEPREMINDYRPREEGSPVPVEAELSIVEGAKIHGPWKNGSLSRLSDSTGALLTMSGPFRYRIRFNLGNLPLDAQLRTTPIVDDVTIFYRAGGPEFLAYWLDNRIN